MLIVNTSEVEALKRALAEAKKEADEERAARKNHEVRLEEVQQELTDAINKCESLERKVSDQESELVVALQSAKEARLKPKVPIRRSARPRRSRLVRLLICRANM